MLSSLILALVPALSFVPSAFAASSTINVTKNAKLGNILTDENGMTLYTFKNDKPGQSTCTGTCAQTWPPLTIGQGVTPTVGSGVTGKVATLTRQDGALQVTYNGLPLYRYAGDTKAGDANGQGIGGLWYAATPGGATKAAAKKSPSKPTKAYGKSSGYGNYGGYGMYGGYGYGMYGGYGYGMYGYGCPCGYGYGYGYGYPMPYTFNHPYWAPPFHFYGFHGGMMRR